MHQARYRLTKFVDHIYIHYTRHVICSCMYMYMYIVHIIGGQRKFNLREQSINILVCSTCEKFGGTPI